MEKDRRGEAENRRGDWGKPKSKEDASKAEIE
jgi:hypothetical protein